MPFRDLGNGKRSCKARTTREASRAMGMVAWP